MIDELKWKLLTFVCLIGHIIHINDPALYGGGGVFYTVPDF